MIYRDLPTARIPRISVGSLMPADPRMGDIWSTAGVRYYWTGRNWIKLAR